MLTIMNKGHMMASHGLFVLALLFATTATATSWMGPRPLLVASPDTQIIVRIEVGDIGIVPYNYTDLQAPTNARAIYYRRDYSTESFKPYLEVILPHPIAPLEIHVNNDGVLVTLDNQENPGNGTSLAIFDVNGRIVRRYELSDIYTDEAIRDFPAGMGFLYWRDSRFNYGMDSEYFQVLDKFANKLKFRLTDGALSHRGNASEKIRGDD